jgi:hypothetical protein
MGGSKTGAVKEADSVGPALGEWKCFCLIIALSPLGISRCWRDVTLHYIPPIGLPADVQFELETPCLCNKFAVIPFNLKSAVLRRFLKFTERFLHRIFYASGVDVAVVHASYSAA